MFKFKHYGIDVIYQECEPGEFEEQLRKQGIRYKHLPILDKKIIKYAKTARTSMHILHTAQHVTGFLSVQRFRKI